MSPKPWTISEPASGFASILDANGELVFAISVPSKQYGDQMPTEQIEANVAELLRCLNGAQ